MKKQIALFAIVAAALIAAPSVVSAQDTKSADKKTEAGTSAKKQGVPPLNGKVAAVDAAAGTVTVGQTTVHITSETKILKQGQPATIADVVVGEKISCKYQKDDAGKLTATAIHIGGKGDKGEGKKKKSE
jgi:protein-disulfide isomerase